MTDTLKDVDAATAQLAGLINALATDFNAAIANLQAEVAAGNIDATPEVNAILALETPVQNLDAAAKAILAPAITSPATASGQNGTAFSYQIAATNSPTTFGATGLPTGLSVNASTGAITGTLPAAGTYTFTVSATNASGTGTLSVTLTVS